jgi:hypothetical protein
MTRPYAPRAWRTGSSSGRDNQVVILMAVLGAALVGGLALTARWSRVGYRAAIVGAGSDRRAATSAREMATTYLRGVATALVAGFWAGLLVTGPAIRLIMRLLAVTGGDDAQGRITEADEVVGEIDLGGTIGLLVFGGLLAGIVSAAIYVVVRRWLPTGRWAGVAFGGLHLVIAATRLDPLRPDNPDFDLVGPSWLAVSTFGLAAMAHGMAIVAFANRYSSAFLPDPDPNRRLARRRIALPLVLPGLFALATVAVPLAVVAGLGVVLAVSRIGVLVEAARSRALLVGGRVALAGITLVMLPGAATDLHDILNGGDADQAELGESSVG